MAVSEFNTEPSMTFRECVVEFEETTRDPPIDVFDVFERDPVIESGPPTERGPPRVNEPAIEEFEETTRDPPMDVLDVFERDPIIERGPPTERGPPRVNEPPIEEFEETTRLPRMIVFDAVNGPDTVNWLPIVTDEEVTWRFEFAKYALESTDSRPPIVTLEETER